MPLWGGIISCTNDDERQPHHTTAHYKEAQEVRERSRLNQNTIQVHVHNVHAFWPGQSGKGTTVHVGQAKQVIGTTQHLTPLAL